MSRISERACVSPIFGEHGGHDVLRPAGVDHADDRQHQHVFPHLRHGRGHLQHRLVLVADDGAGALRERVHHDRGVEVQELDDGLVGLRLRRARRRSRASTGAARRPSPRSTPAATARCAVRLAHLLAVPDVRVVHPAPKKLQPIVPLQLLNGCELLRAGEELVELRQRSHPVVELLDERIHSRHDRPAVLADSVQIRIGQAVLRDQALSSHQSAPILCDSTVAFPLTTFCKCF